ncbi:MAG TPA: hypothetical protein VGL56_08385 [Fimbriimonadaceae bacterium]
MKHFQKLVTGIILFSFCAVAMASTSIVGKWKGHLEVNWAKLGSKMSPDQLAKAKKQVGSLKIVMEFKANKTFTASGGPMGPQSGTWTATATEVDLISPKAKSKPQAFSIAKGGKSMSTALPGGAGKFTLTKS